MAVRPPSGHLDLGGLGDQQAVAQLLLDDVHQARMQARVGIKVFMRRSSSTRRRRVDRC